MQRKILHGVPYFTDSEHRLFLWDTEASPVCIGSYDPKTELITYDNTAVTNLGNRLQEWRGKQNARPRKSTATASKRRGNTSAASDSSSDASDNE